MKLSSTEIEKDLERWIKNFDGKALDLTTLSGALLLINRLKAENKNCGVKIQNQREQLKACNEKIKEQQAEIERLTSENERLYGKVEELSLVLSDTIKIRYKEAKSEAVKEFAERLKALLPNDGMSPEGRFKFGRIKSLDIDNLLKEMG